MSITRAEQDANEILTKTDEKNLTLEISAENVGMLVQAQTPNLIQNPDYGMICKQPDYDVKLEREKMYARPLGEGRRVVIICCFDPRCDAAAELILKHINYTGLFLQVRVAGGRSVDALRSLIVAHYLFNIETIVVVHHTFCGCTTFTASTITKALKEEDGICLSEKTFSRETFDALTIDDLSKSVKDDVRLIQERVASRLTKLWGFVYDIRTYTLIEITQMN